MKSIITEYPDFRELPKAVKQMLLTSEEFFFADTKPPAIATEHRQLSRNFWAPPHELGRQDKITATTFN